VGVRSVSAGFSFVVAFNLNVHHLTLNWRIERFRTSPGPYGAHGTQGGHWTRCHDHNTRGTRGFTELTAITREKLAPPLPRTGYFTKVVDGESESSDGEYDAQSSSGGKL